MVIFSPSNLPYSPVYFLYHYFFSRYERYGGIGHFSGAYLISNFSLVVTVFAKNKHSSMVLSSVKKSPALFLSFSSILLSLKYLQCFMPYLIISINSVYG